MRYFVVDHPNQLPLALGYLKKKAISSREARLIVSLHDQWEKTDRKFIGHFFDRVYYLPRPDFSWILPKHFCYLLYAKLFLKNLKISVNDTFYCFSAGQFIENLIVSTYKKNYKELLIPETVFREYDFKNRYRNFKETLLSRLYNLAIYPIFGMSETKRLVHKDSIFLGFPVRYYDGGKTHLYDIKLLAIYDRIVIFENITDRLNSHKTTRIVEMHYPFPMLLKRAKLGKKQSRQNIIFLGSNFIGESTMEMKSYIIYLNMCLEYLRRFYPRNKFNLFYKRHPVEGKEVNYLGLEDFEILRTDDSMEIFLIRNSTMQIKAVFSVASTALRSSLNFGLNSYVFFHLFPFSKRTLEYYDNLFGSLPKYSYVKSFETKVKDIF